MATDDPYGDGGGARVGKPDTPKRDNLRGGGDGGNLGAGKESTGGISEHGNPADTADQLRQSLAVLARSRASLINISDVLEGLTRGLRGAGVESAFVWAETEAWRFEVDDEGRPLDPRRKRS